MKNDPIYRKRRAKLAAHLLTQKNPKKFEFRMENYRQASGCGTAGCIAGMACALFDSKNYFSETSDEMRLHDIARDLLGLENRESMELFIPNGYMSAVEVEAGRVVAHMTRTGEIDWGVYRDPVKVGRRTF